MEVGQGHWCDALVLTHEVVALVTPACAGQESFASCEACTARSPICHSSDSAALLMVHPPAPSSVRRSSRV